MVTGGWGLIKTHSDEVIVRPAVYLYGEAARSEARRSLPSVRAGEYEALPEKVRRRAQAAAAAALDFLWMNVCVSPFS